jgi:hypothetical protein
MFRGERPKDQPPTLRQRAEQNDPAGFDGGIAYVPLAGVPANVAGATQTYHDHAAEDLALVPTARSSAADPSPFTVTKGG